MAEVKMDSDALKPILGLAARHALTAIGGYLVSSGYLQSSDTNAFIGAGMVLAGIVWSWWQKRGQAKVAELLKKVTARATTTDAVAMAKIAAPGSAIPKVLLLAALASGLLMWGGDVRAQTKLGPIATKILEGGANNAGAAASTAGIPKDLLGALDEKILPDLTYAKAMADATGSVVTGNCYGAWIKIIQSRQQALKDASGQPLALPDLHLITDFERAVELRNALQPTSDFSIACSPVANMVKKDILNFIGVVMGGGASLSLLGVGL
jgi:hypothetical protein